MRDFREYLIEKLKDPSEAISYLTVRRFLSKITGLFKLE